MATFELGRRQRALGRGMTGRAAREARALWAAAIFFTRLPLPALPVLLPEDERRATACWPLVGAGVGAAVAGVAWLAAQSFPPGVAAGLALAAGLLLTGALHEDGFADVCDGLRRHRRPRTGAGDHARFPAGRLRRARAWSCCSG